MSRDQSRKLAETVREQIKTVASDFSLDYNDQYFVVNFLSSENVLLLLFLMGRSLNLESSYGSTVTERIANLDSFKSSQAFHDLAATPLGVVVEKATLQIVLQKVYGDIRSHLHNLYESLDWGAKVQVSQSTTTEVTVAVSEISTASATQQIQALLLHEWLHLLLWSNDINFQKIEKKYWKEDEGLTKYLELYLETMKRDLGNIIMDKLQALSEKDSAWKTRIKLEAALKWNRRLKSANDPGERKRILLLQRDRMRAEV